MHYSSLIKAALTIALGVGLQGVSAAPKCEHDCCWAIHLWKDLGKETDVDASNPTGCCGQHGISCSESSVTQLDWGYRDLEGKIPSYIAELKELTSLNLAKNAKLKNYESLKDLEKLNYLNIRHNDLKSVPDTVIEMKNLRGLEIAFNPLDTIPRELVTKKDLNRLMIDPCQIRAVPDHITGNVDAEFHIVVKSDSLDCPAVKYRYVMIRREKPSWDDNACINLAEVEIYSKGINVAKSKSVTASSIGYGWDSKRIVDGKKQTPWHDHYHSGYGAHEEWIRIDLGEEVNVDEVIIYNRINGWRYRSGNIRIHLSTDGTTDLKVSDPISREQAEKFKFTWKPQEGTSITAE